MLAARTAGPSDFPALVQCDAYARSNDHRQQMLRLAIAAQTCNVGLVRSEVVGFFVLDYSFFGNGFIPLISVATEQQGHGFGLRLLSIAESMCRTRKIFTSTNASNVRAQRLFTSAGFVPSGSIDNLDSFDSELVYFKAV